MKCVFQTYNVFEADVIVAKLKSNGIESYGHSREHNSQEYFLQFALGGIKVMVSEDEFEKAHALITDTEEPSKIYLINPKLRLALWFITIVPTILLLFLGFIYG